MHLYIGKQVAFVADGRQALARIISFIGENVTVEVDGGARLIKALGDLFPPFNSEVIEEHLGFDTMNRFGDMDPDEGRYIRKPSIEKYLQIAYKTRTGVTRTLRVKYRVYAATILVDGLMGSLVDNFKYIENTTGFTKGSNSIDADGVSEASIVPIYGAQNWYANGIRVVPSSGTSLHFAAKADGGIFKVDFISGTSVKMRYETEPSDVETVVETGATSTTFAAGDAITLMDTGGKITLEKNGATFFTFALNTPGEARSGWGLSNGAAYSLSSVRIIARAIQVSSTLRVRHNLRGPRPYRYADSSTLDRVYRQDSNLQTYTFVLPYKSVAVRYGVLTTTTSSIPMSYTVSSGVTSAIALKYALKGSVTSAIAFKYALKGSVTSAIAFKYALKGTM